MMISKRLVTVLFALVLLMPAGATAKKEVDWPQFRFDAGNTGYNKFEKVINKNNVGTLTQAWDYFLTGECISANAIFFSSPVADGKIYVVSEDCWDGFLIAFDASTGERLWDFPTGYIGRVVSAPAVANGVVYAVTSSGALFALDAASGEIRWGKSIAYWAIPYKTISTPTVDNGVVYVTSEFGEKLYAFDAKNGDLLWDYPTGSHINLVPALANGVVYLSTDSEIHAIDAANGTNIWTIPALSLFDHPVVAQGKVFVGGYALDAATGELLWSYCDGEDVSSPAVANGVVYTCTSGGRIVALKAATGQVLWSTETGAPGYFASPTVANGVVYVGSDVGVYALDAATGELLENTIAGAGYFWGYVIEYRSPVAVNGMVYTSRGAYKLGEPKKTAKSKPAVKAK